MNNINDEDIDTVIFNKKSFRVLGLNNKSLGTFSYNKSFRTKGKVRWFDKSSGMGSIRLDSDISVTVYACNIKGANSMYEHLVTNVTLEQDQDVSVNISCDSYTFNALGATKVEVLS